MLKAVVTVAKEVIHFENQTDRLNFIRGKHTEIKPVEAKKKAKKTTKKKTEKKTEKKGE